MTRVEIADIVRYVSLAEIYLSIGFCLGAITNAKQYARWPYHFIGFYISYMLYAIGASIEIMLRLHYPPTWRTPVLLAAATVGFTVQAWALLVLLPRRDRRRDREWRKLVEEENR